MNQVVIELKMERVIMMLLLYQGEMIKMMCLKLPLTWKSMMRLLQSKMNTNLIINNILGFVFIFISWTIKAMLWLWIFILSIMVIIQYVMLDCLLLSWYVVIFLTYLFLWILYCNRSISALGDIMKIEFNEDLWLKL